MSHVLTEVPCPRCGKPIAMIESSNGTFYGCSGWTGRADGCFFKEQQEDFYLRELDFRIKHKQEHRPPTTL